MTSEPPRQLPMLERASRFFWESCADGTLRIQRCQCGHYQHPPLPLCVKCGSDALAPEPVSGRGRVASFTINRQAWLPGLAPYVFAAIELVEQRELFVFSNVIGCPVDTVGIGMAVSVTFEPVEDVWLPLFAPYGEADG